MLKNDLRSFPIGASPQAMLQAGIEREFEVPFNSAGA
jgi:hypothetical protein